MFPRHPVLVLAGNYGSGKTELAVNLCLGLAAAGQRVTLVDLDIVKPFFRSREARRQLEALGVRLVAPPGEQFYSDLPVVLPEVRGLIAHPPGIVVLDVGGDAGGARVLSSLAGVFRPDGHEFLLVLNTSRPFTTDVAGLGRMCREIRAAAGLAPTGLVANTHLLEETEVATVCEGHDLALTLGQAMGLPLRMLACLEPLAALLPPGRISCPVLPLRRLLVHAGSAGVRKSPLYYVT